MPETIVKYDAVDEPAYQALRWEKERAGMTDEDYAMSAAIPLVRDVRYNAACDAMVEELRTISNMRHVTDDNMSVIYQAAALIFETAKRARFPQEISFRISGRVYSVREVKR